MKKKHFIFIMFILMIFLNYKSIYGLNTTNEEELDYYELDELFGYWNSYYNFGEGTGEEYEKEKANYISTMIELGYMSQAGEWNDTAKQVINEMKNESLDWDKWYPLLKQSATEELAKREEEKQNIQNEKDTNKELQIKVTKNINIKILIIVISIGFICVIVLLVIIIKHIRFSKKQ